MAEARPATEAAERLKAHTLPPGTDVNLMPPRIRRVLQLATYGIAAGMLYYIVLQADFGPKEHVFSPLRRLYRRQLDRFWSVSPEDEARYRSAASGGKAEPATKPASGAS